MRHYDRTEFRHLDDAQRYRDHEFKADDGWIGPNEVPREAVQPRPSPPPWRAPRSERRRPVTRRWLYRARTLLSRVVDTIFHPRRAGMRALRAAVRAVARRVP